MADTLSSEILNLVRPQAPAQDVEVQDTDSSPKEVIRELKEVLYGNKDVSDFTEFLRESSVPGEGEYTFSVDTKYLKYACGILKHVYQGSKVSPNLIKVIVFENQLKVSGFNTISFAEVFIPLTRISSVGKGPEIAFVFDYPTLAKITASFEKTVLDFTYKAEKAVLEVNSGSTHLELSTREEQDFIKFHNKIKDIKPVDCNLDLEILQIALNYLSLFVRKDSQANLSLFECRDSSIVGGNYSSIGILNSETLNKVPLRLGHDVVPTLSKVLPYFYGPKIRLFETEGYYILRDQNLYLGVEKTETSFPALKSLLSNKVEESYSLPRQSLLSSLHKLSVVTGEKDILIRFQVSGRPPESVLTLSIKDVTGRKSKDVLPILRQNTTGIFADHEFFIYLEVLVKAVSFFKTPEVWIQEIKEKAISIRDVQTLFTTQTILSLTKEEDK